MKGKFLFVCVALCFMICGCGNSISQSEYNAVIEERDELQKQLDELQSEKDKMQKWEEVKLKAVEYQTKVDYEYSHAMFVLYVVKKATNTDTSEAENSLKEGYEAVNKAFDVKDIAEQYSDSEDVISSTNDMLDTVYDSWSKFYDTIEVMEDNLMQN